LFPLNCYDVFKEYVHGLDSLTGLHPELSLCQFNLWMNHFVILQETQLKGKMASK